MNMLYNIIAFIFVTAFFVLMFLVAWYIALPFLLIALAIWVFQQFAIAIKGGHRVIIRKQKPAKAEPEIIDVEYKEL